MNSPTAQTGWRDEALAVSYLDGLSDPVVALDPGGRILEANSAFSTFARADRADLLGRALGGALEHRPHLAPFVERAERLARAGDPGREILYLADGAGEEITLLLTAIPLGLPDRGRLRAIRVEDVTEMARERAANDAERIAATDSARALERLNEELEGFSYSVAHDLRAPLRFIDKFAYLLMDRHGHELSSEGLQYAEQIREGTRQMAQLVEDLLQFSRVTGQVLHRESVDLNRLVEQVIAEARYEIEDEDRAVDFRVGDLGIAEGDPTLVRQVFANLIGNAVKFTRGKDPAAIEISRRVEGGHGVYTVADNGVGFEADEAERLFTVFQRFHQPDEYEGSGVGLAVVKRVVSRHGGSVWAESHPGEGARFHFTIEPGAPAPGES
ncbi:MAG: PAS domain-containing protein [Candidatus Hydrogenedentes bacterium]|nr:PAS domain-containing protein [Candidatus Hydrogenedentota bacterium]